MKNLFKHVFFIALSVLIFGCESDDDQVDLSDLAAPSNLGATFKITQDNSGLVTIIPKGESANTFTVDFGDGSALATDIKAGETVDHIFAEGDYDVEVIGFNLNGRTATGTQPLTVSFRAPEGLEVNINKAPDDNYTINVSAAAEYAAMFEVYFGDVDDEEPTPMMIGETVSHTYENVGDYDVRVVALSGGSATTELTQTVEIRDPLFLPIDFESPTKNYTFINFGPDEVVDPVIDNPDPSGINTSSKVATYTKPAGSQPWAGTTTALDQPIDFSTQKYISVDVWSPTAGTPVTFKIENLDDAGIFVESSSVTTVSNQWETLTFDMTAVDQSIDYGRIVLFFNLGTPGTGETYYFDNIKTTTLEPLKLPMTFDSAIVNYTPGVFGGASFEVVSNPDLSGANTSATMVGAITNAGNAYEGLAFNLGEPVDFSGDNKTITMKFWSDVALPVLLKFEGGVNGERQTEVSANHTGSGWEELSFNFATDAIKSYIDGNQGAGEPFVPTGQYATMTMFVDGPGNTSGTFYVDDIQFAAGETQYISLFSDFGDDVNVDTWRTDWSNSGYEEIEFDGRLTKHYFNLGFVGIETIAEPIDASEMTYFHTEIYTDNATVFRIKLVDLGPDGVYAGDDLSEHEIIIENPAQNEWVVLDIPLSEFTGLQSRAHIGQLIYSAEPAGTANVYVDNVYFHN
ncbi:hypothetical protein C8P64_0829 [Christiangramia gaetbulicola]|uniref:PKD/Chitinase domain-containing protein n=1 Tax=Christiangramia gaetbulicola TaxID=703340 RepID=A0A2T6AM60_9FLAO|nr:PKD domain-containing protein [Christiangramia gaetbulicola]PTX44846.1 hypothetical protein C8P64_0829 [Christiangramia gaetbulicola]